MNNKTVLTLLTLCLPILGHGQSPASLGSPTVLQKLEKGQPVTELEVRVANNKPTEQTLTVRAACVFDAIEKSSKVKYSGYMIVPQNQKLTLQPRQSQIVTLRVIPERAAGDVQLKKKIVGYHMELLADGQVVDTKHWEDEPTINRLRRTNKLPETWWLR